MGVIVVKKTKICIVGCGSIGTWLGAHLGGLGDVELSCLVRGTSVEHIKTNGLQLDSRPAQGQPLEHSCEDSRLCVFPKFVSDDAHAIGPQDWIILSVKATSLIELIPQLIPMVGPHTSLWTAMNGLPWWFMKGLHGPLQNHSFKSIDPERLLANAIPLEHWVGGVVHSSCSLIDKGHALHHFGNGLVIGEPATGHKDQISPRVLQLTQLLQGAGFDSKASHHIQKDIWYKLWGNMTMNPISALTGATTDKILGDPLLNAFLSGVMLEAREIGARIGIPISQTPEDRHLVTAKLGAFKTSMLQDIEQRRAVELDVLLTAVLELASWTEVPTPLTNALLGLARVQAQTLGLYP